MRDGGGVGRGGPVPRPIFVAVGFSNKHACKTYQESV